MKRTSHGEMDAEGFRCDCHRIWPRRGRRRARPKQAGDQEPLLERGAGALIRGTTIKSVALALVPGRRLLFNQELLALVRGITVGGSSILAYATAFELPYEMFESHGIDLTEEVEHIKSELPIGPLADHLVGPAARR